MERATHTATYTKKQSLKVLTAVATVGGVVFGLSRCSPTAPSIFRNRAGATPITPQLVLKTEVLPDVPFYETLQQLEPEQVIQLSSDKVEELRETGTVSVELKVPQAPSATVTAYLQVSLTEDEIESSGLKEVEGTLTPERSGDKSSKNTQTYRLALEEEQAARLRESLGSAAMTIKTPSP